MIQYEYICLVVSLQIYLRACNNHKRIWYELYCSYVRINVDLRFHFKPVTYIQIKVVTKVRSSKREIQPLGNRVLPHDRTWKTEHIRFFSHQEYILKYHMNDRMETENFNRISLCSSVPWCFVLNSSNITCSYCSGMLN